MRLPACQRLLPIMTRRHALQGRKGLPLRTRSRVQGAAMRLRAHRRNLVVWSPSVGLADRYGGPSPMRPARARRIRRGIRVGALLTVIGLRHLARGVRPRWRPLLAGTVLTVAGVMLRSGAWGTLLLAGLWFFVYALLIPASSGADRKRHCELERELAGYSTPAQRRDLEATFDRYPDAITHELRDILAKQALVACSTGIPGAGR
jgi:hypothetical protein